VKQDLLYEAWVMLAYNNPRPNLTKSERGRINAGLKELREVGATPEELTARAKQYPKVMPPGTILTITALVANWNRCQPKPQKRVVSYHEEWKTPEWMRRELK